MSGETPPAEGECWAYRARGTDPFSEVEIVRYGTKKPPRVLVRFIADEDEGREKWVSPSRLKVPWSQQQAYLKREQRWRAVRSDAYLRDTPTGWAIGLICDNLPQSWRDQRLVEDGYNDDTGVFVINDVDALLQELGLERNSLLEHALCFQDGSRWIVPWSVGQQIVKRLAERFAEPLLAVLDAADAKAEEKNRWGSFSKHRHISAETHAAVDAEFGQGRAIAREWCGRAAGERRDELLALREEVVRLGLLVETAVTALRAAGAERSAQRIADELGVPVGLIQAHAAEQRR